MSDLIFSMKAVINKDKNKVLFVEIDNNFADVLLRFSTLPLEDAMYAFVQHYGNKVPVIGSLNNLYNEFDKLCYVSSRADYLINNIKVCKFPCGDQGLEFNNILPWRCKNVYDSLRLLICKNDAHKEYFWFPKIILGNKSFVIFDDLRMVANGDASFLNTIISGGLSVADMNGVEIRNVILGVDEVMRFLALTLISHCPLTEAVLGLEVKVKVKEEMRISCGINDMKMKLKLTIQKSCNKILFAQADKVFVNSLYGIFTIPVGKIDTYLGSNTWFNRLESLQKALTVVAPKYLCDEKKVESFPTKLLTLKNDGPNEFMVTDGLSVTPFSVIYGLSVLENLKISLSDVEELELQIGYKEVIHILRASLTSTTALTDGLRAHKLMKERKVKQEH